MMEGSGAGSGYVVPLTGGPKTYGFDGSGFGSGSATPVYIIQGLMLDGSGSGYVPLTNGSGSRRPKNIWICIRNDKICIRIMMSGRKTWVSWGGWVTV